MPKEKINLVEAINLALKEEMTQDKNVIVYGEDVGFEGGVFRVTEGLQKQFGEQRCFDSPLCESGIVGTAIGAAIYGLKPVVEIQFAGFLYSAYDQLISHAARIRTRSRGRFTCPLVVRTPYGGGIKALEHHSESMEAIYAHTPGLKVVIPSGPQEAYGLLRAAIQDPDPVIFLEPTRIYRAIKEEAPAKDLIIPLGKANIVQTGDQVTVIAWGAMLREVKKALALLAQEKDAPAVELIDLRTISPLDTETIVKSVEKTGHCVIVHEAPRSGGIAAEIIARINEKALLSLEAPVKRITGFDTVFPLYQNESLYLPSPEQIAAGIKAVINF
ncbi:MAG: 2-oxoisovalerate dehydrogenase [Candidatus Abawacabacteria bacterium RIFCSPHIGHO2_01_FULL_46_8]|uniref:2-oxoisovalerate dehydrogenase n=1 Tax=Candidatus Abawacabacteria bacterium RIFCSPHIGHO2_01_FULL_46_8 TaxID=1817815 RepID=A0A1F4XIV0_9BACT|nr:MAG: 2-oxoisovalerate dehydrogenase [Candidatus Abawacabacteria bacterium RIFCSPHIGHO2_01_FULL_46_8]